MNTSAHTERPRRRCLRRRPGTVAILLAATTVAAPAGASRAAAPPPPPPTSGDPAQPYVTWEQYQRVLQDQAEMRKELDELKRQQAATVTPPPSGDAAADAADMEQEIHKIQDEVDKYKAGIENVTIVGDANVGFTAQRKNNSTFSAGVSPLILWQPAPWFLWETAFDVNVGTDENNVSSTTFDLTIANGSFLVNDYLAVGGGLFIAPFGVYHNHFDPPWINKFPDDPLVFSDTIAPNSIVGVYARGAIPIASTKVTYDAYVSNGPNLEVKDPGSAGSLNLEDYTDLNNNKAVGGRIGFLPVPNVEMGYSVMSAQVNPNKFEKVNALLQAVDLNYRQIVDPLYGTFDFRTEWVWSHVDKATYDPDGSLGFGPISFNNDRSGGYVQLCFRPTQVDSEVLRNVEFVSRYDVLIVPTHAPGGDHEKRITLGVDYWFSPQIVLKAAYEFDDKQVGPSENAFLMQLGVGL